MKDRPKRAGKRIGCAAIVSAAVAAMGLSVHHGVQFTSSFVTPGEIQLQAGCTHWEEYIYQAIRSQVPEGAAVYVHGPTLTLTHRLAELATPWAVPQASLDTASWMLTLLPADRPCVGLSLLAIRE